MMSKLPHRVNAAVARDNDGHKAVGVLPGLGLGQEQPVDGLGLPVCHDAARRVKRIADPGVLLAGRAAAKSSGIEELKRKEKREV